MKVLVIGATGVLGRNVLPRLVERGHAVRAIIVRQEWAPFLVYAGVEPVLGDIFDPDSLDRAARGCDAALHLATAIPRAGDGDWSINDRIRREGTANFIAAASNRGVGRYIQQSVALVYGEYGQTIVDESAPLQPVPVVQSAVDMEALVRNSDLSWCILRAGLFYGPGTGREAEWRLAAQQQRLQLPGDGRSLLSLVHVVDMARAVVLAMESAPAGSVYNVVDDEPVSYERLFNYIVTQLNETPPTAGGPQFLPSLGCTNARIKKALGWRPSYPSYRSGLA